MKECQKFYRKAWRNGLWNIGQRWLIYIYKEHISEINSEYDLLGEPIVGGDNQWDINPEYGRFVRSKMRPHLRPINKQFVIFQYDIDEIGDLIAYVKGIKKSKLYIELIESE